MKIYTRRGDGGETDLRLGVRTGKDHPRVEACGAVDELNSCLGWARSQGLDPDNDRLLARIQGDLFVIGADLATAGEDDRDRRLPADAAQFMEAAIDRMDAQLAPLKRFILPGGSPSAAALHVARAVCRRAERAVVALRRSETVDHAITAYLNRLSDLLFVMARDQNRLAGRPDEPLPSDA